MSFIHQVISEFNQIPGWHTRSKIIVIESDDWGTIRMPSADAYQRLFKNGVPVNQDPYTRFDALESNDDLADLLQVLSMHKNTKGVYPILTANTIVANPDFEKIKASGYTTYHYEPFVETLKRYPKHQQVLDLYREGLQLNLLKPQLHGREHVNIEQWLGALREHDLYVDAGFAEKTFAIAPKSRYNKRNNFMSSLDFENERQRLDIKKIITEGAELFEKIFGFQSRSFIAPTYVWDNTAEQALYEAGIRTLQGISYQYIPDPGAAWYRKKYRFTGMRNDYKQVSLTRNCFFEPTLMPHMDTVSACLKRIERAFRWHKPAIISTHRLNFIGFIDPANRDKNLKLFGSLLKKITQTWPDVEFMSSDQLGDLIAGKSNV